MMNIETQIQEKTITLYSARDCLNSLREQKQSIVQKAVDTFIPVAKDRIKRTIKSQLVAPGKSKKSSYKNHESDSDSDEDIYTAPKISKRFKDLAEDIRVIMHIERFPGLLQRWPVDCQDFDVFVAWSEKLENLYMTHQCGRELILTLRKHKIIFVSELITVKDYLNNIKILLKPFAQELSMLEKLLIQWSTIGHSMKAVMTMTIKHCTYHALKAIMEAKKRAAEKQHGLNLSELSTEARREVLRSQKTSHYDQRQKGAGGGRRQSEKRWEPRSTYKPNPANDRQRPQSSK